MSDLLQVNGSVHSPRKFSKKDKRKQFVLVQLVTLTSIEDKATATRGDDNIFKFTGSEAQILEDAEGQKYMEQLQEQARKREEDATGQSPLALGDDDGPDASVHPIGDLPGEQ